MSLPPLADSAKFAALGGKVPAGFDIDRLLEAASDRVRRYCGWHIYPQMTETVRVTANGGGRAFLPTLHLVSVTSVTDNGVVLDMTTVDWDEAGFLERCNTSGVGPTWNHFTSRRRAIVAVITHGFDDGVQDVMDVVVAAAARKAQSPTGAIREQAGAVGVSYSQVAPNVSGGGVALLQHEKDTLSEYRIPRNR